MPSKYDKLRKKIPLLRKSGGTHDDRVSKRKAEILETLTESKSEVGDIAELYKYQRMNRDLLKEEMSALQVDIDAIEQILMERYEDAGITSVNLVSGGRVSVQIKPYPKIVDREAYRQWCLNNGYEREMHLHSSTTTSILADRLLKGEPSMPGIEPYIDESITFRKGGGTDDDE
jgi:hypothetical protein